MSIHITRWMRPHSCPKDPHTSACTCSTSTSGAAVLVGAAPCCPGMSQSATRGTLSPADKSGYTSNLSANCDSVSTLLPILVSFNTFSARLQLGACLKAEIVSCLSRHRLLFSAARRCRHMYYFYTSSRRGGTTSCITRHAQWHGRCLHWTEFMGFRLQSNLDSIEVRFATIFQQ